MVSARQVTNSPMRINGSQPRAGNAGGRARSAHRGASAPVRGGLPVRAGTSARASARRGSRRRRAVPRSAGGSRRAPRRPTRARSAGPCRTRSPGSTKTRRVWPMTMSMSRAALRMRKAWAPYAVPVHPRSRGLTTRPLQSGEQRVAAAHGDVDAVVEAAVVGAARAVGVVGRPGAAEVDHAPVLAAVPRRCVRVLVVDPEPPLAGKVGARRAGPGAGETTRWRRSPPPAAEPRHECACGTPQGRPSISRRRVGRHDPSGPPGWPVRGISDQCAPFGPNFVSLVFRFLPGRPQK